MNQKQIFTEYWKVLDDFEDYMNDRFRRERLNVPEFKVSLNNKTSLNPEECCACSLHEHNKLRSPVLGEGRKKLLIINRALPKVLADKEVHFTPEEEHSIIKWLEAIGLDLKRDCTIVPLLFCPVKNPLDPGVEAVKSCFPFVDQVIEKTEAKAILVLGVEGESFFREKVDQQWRYKNTPLFISHHPSDVLINASLKRPVWEVLKSIKDVLIGG
jgi:DNA polymerase